MLRWRIPLGILFIAALVGLCWLDHVLPVPGIVLLPVAVLLVVLAGDEMLRFFAAVGLRPSAWAVHAGNLLLLAGSALPVLGWYFFSRVPFDRDQLGTATFTVASTPTLLALAAAVLIVFVAEMRRYEKPGNTTESATGNAAAAVFAIVYVGLLMSFAVGLRMIWGIAALGSMVIVVKLGDIGAYTVGRLIGRHKMAPTLSPGKTIEGCAGALLFSCLGAWATFHWLVPMVNGTESPEPGYGWLILGLAVSVAGILGDLAESLIKRDVGLKDSSRWMPGFGGVLDMLDSVLLAAPAAYACWALGLVGQ